LRAGASWDRLRWSVAHEIGHATLHRRQRDGDIESQANEFACELLVPGVSLAREWPKNPTIMSLLPLKERWGLSIQALTEHGFRLGLLDESKRMRASALAWTRCRGQPATGRPFSSSSC
jgi:Zn-dependent peptidase ImmA (M78 family)